MWTALLCCHAFRTGLSNQMVFGSFRSTACLYRFCSLRISPQSRVDFRIGHDWQSSCDTHMMWFDHLRSSLIRNLSRSTSTAYTVQDHVLTSIDSHGMAFARTITTL